MAIKIAFGSVPKDSGTFTFYRNQRPALASKGVDMYCVSVGKEEADLWEDPYADDHCILLAPNTYTLKKQAKAFVSWVKDNQIDIVIAINSKAILSAIPHLPKEVRLVSRCANAFDYGYRITMSGRARLAAIIALTPRLSSDLIERYHADPKLIHLIPNGIQASKYKQAAAQLRADKSTLQLVFVGRLEHNQKGVLFIPEILKELDKRDIPYHLAVAGKGKHEDQLKALLHSQVLASKVEFLGAQDPEEIVELLADSDILLFTSQFEGCPNVLLEAMMAGVVPVCYSIGGITDYLVDSGKTGYIVKKEDAVEMAAVISKLHEDRDLVRKLSTNTQRIALERFSNEKCAEEYTKVFQQVMEAEPPECIVKEWKDFTPDENIEKGRFAWVPTSIRHSVKKILTGK